MYTKFKLDHESSMFTLHLIIYDIIFTNKSKDKK